MAASLESADGDVGFQIAPMVDVVFVLMLFFMAAAGAQVLTKELRVALPAPHAGGGETLAIVDIAADGSVIFNGESLGSPLDSELPQLRARFQHIIEQFGDKDAVLIRPASSIRHERVMEVLSAVQAAGVGKVTFL
jgi:biopolymer transport protein ExbD